MENKLIWIAVKDQLPKDQQNIIFVERHNHSYPEFYTGWYDSNTNNWWHSPSFDGAQQIESKYITHWTIFPDECIDFFINLPVRDGYYEELSNGK